MQNLNGQSTSNTKRSLEGYMFIEAINQIHNVGQYSSLGNGSGSYSQVNDTFPAANNAPYTFNASGEDLILRVSSLSIQSQTAMVVTVTGTAVGGGGLTGTAIFPAGAPEDSAEQVISTTGGKFASVTNVTATNGVFGDGLELDTFPNYNSKVEIGFQEGINLDLGVEVSPVWYHYLIDHIKRARRQGKLTIENLYQSNLLGLSAYNNKPCHIIVEIRDNGQASPTEVWIIDKAAGTAKKKLGKGDDPLTETYDGFFGRIFVLS